MSDKDQFTFEDDDDFPETKMDDQSEPQESDLSDERLPETSQDGQDESQESVLGYENSAEFSLGGDEPEKSPELDLSYEDDFPETDLSGAFSEGEHAAEDSVLDSAEPAVKVDGNARTRILLMVLLLVIAGGAGAYYFMGLGGTTPSVPTVPVPAQKTTKSVALPAQSNQTAAVPTKAEPAAKPVTVAVPPPPPPAEPADKVSPVQDPVAVAAPQASPASPASPAAPAAKPAEMVVATKPKVEPAMQPAAQVAVPAPLPQPSVAETKAAPEPAPQKAAVSVPPTASAQAAVPTGQVVGGAFALDAGSYLFDSNRDSLVAKIKKLGYEPFITPVDATLDMTRLRLGTFSKDEVQEALDFARSIEPGAYSAPAGDGYVVYAGTFLKSESIDKLSKRFLNEGVKVYPEPVQVVRTLSRVRFGSFATKEAAAAAASELSLSGLKSVVVKSK